MKEGLATTRSPFHLRYDLLKCSLHKKPYQKACNQGLSGFNSKENILPYISYGMAVSTMEQVLASIFKTASSKISCMYNNGASEQPNALEIYDYLIIRTGVLTRFATLCVTCPRTCLISRFERLLLMTTIS